MSYILTPWRNKSAPSGGRLRELRAKTTRQSAAPICRFNKIRAPQRLVRQPVQYPRLCGGPYCLDQVEREAVAVRCVCVQKAESWIKATSTDGQSTLALSHRVRVVEETVGRVD